MNIKKLDKIPVLLYEQSMDGSWESSMPYIEVAVDETMPEALFVQEYKLTGETEPDMEGNECPVFDAYIHQYVNMTTLKESLDAKTYDAVRVALGMKPLKEAKKLGRELMKEIVQDAEKNLSEKHLTGKAKELVQDAIEKAKKGLEK
jgi:hypothetical protein